MLKPVSLGFRGLDAGGAWSLVFGPDGGFKCYAISSGGCWLEIGDGSKPIRVEAGDFVLLSGGRPFRLFSVQDAPPTNAFEFFPTVPAGEIGLLNEGGECSGVGGYFGFESSHSSLLLGMLPPLVHVSSNDSMAVLRGSIERLMRELRSPLPGSSLIAEHLVQALLVEALRVHLAENAAGSAGWLFALADRQMHAAIAAMHGDPGRKWTLAALAKIAGMSRSGFAVRFKATVGEPVMDYLTRWRMMIAAERLSQGNMSIATVAPSVGYESESAFGAAFKRVMGCSPRQFAKASDR
jgi:AraC-like DNA-binding protein